MTHSEIRKKFLDFFEKRGHTILPSASLVPENDPSVLFTTAGMHPLVPYLLGEPHPAGKRLADVQKCVRTQDIDEVGDNTHDTFFEMLGNWSLGDYFKAEAIKWSYEFLTSKDEGLGLDPGRLYITVFEGDENAPKDEESSGIWRSLGIPESRIYFMPAKSNWWSPGPNGPCGPDTEMFYDVTPKGLGDLNKAEFIKADADQKVVEVWNDVFMEYEKRNGQVIGKLKQRNVDTGAGLERLAMVAQEKNNIFDTDLFLPLVAQIKQLAGDSSDERSLRIIADHVRTAVFMIADGVLPSNTDRGYVLRRLLRRAVRYTDKIKMENGHLADLVDEIVNTYKNVYENLSIEKENIKEEISKEEEKFKKTLKNGLNKLRKLAVPMLERFSEGAPIPRLYTMHSREIGRLLFDMFTEQGFPIEMSVEEIDMLRKDLKLKDFPPLSEADKIKLIDEFREEFIKHQELSRAGAERKFKGGLADTGEIATRYHTATHLLHQALRDVLGEHVEQKGSNITSERLRFDFSHPQKLTEEEKRRVEDLVNEKIQASLDVTMSEMGVEEARKSGALGVFAHKYGERVKVYSVGNYSKEICGGPHVKNTKELGVFHIQKEEAVSAGVRRIKAVLE